MSSTFRLTGVGVGPGDPELLTLRAARVLKEAGRVFAPAMAPDVEGRAEWIAARALPGLVMERLVIDLDPAAREAAYAEAARQVAAALDEVGDVAFVTLGDPNVYSTFGYLARSVSELRPEVVVETVPGIMAFQELAARAGTVVLEGSERLVLVSAARRPRRPRRRPRRPRSGHRGLQGRPAPARDGPAPGRGRPGRRGGGGRAAGPARRAGRALAPDTPAAGYLATVIVPPTGRQGTTP